MPTAYYSVLGESLQSDQCFSLFSVILQPLKFADTASAVKTTREVTKINQSFGL